MSSEKTRNYAIIGALAVTSVTFIVLLIVCLSREKDLKQKLDKQCPMCHHSCPKCGSELVCAHNGMCACVPNCTGGKCGADGCGGMCPACSAGSACNAVSQICETSK